MLVLEVMQEQLGKKGQLVTQDTVDELNKLVEDPDYGEEFLDQYVSYFNVLDQNSAWSTPKYMNALKFFSLIESGHTAVDAYVKTFPDRLAARYARGESKLNMGGEASRYNSSALVNEIRKVASISVKLIHRHVLHQAIQTSTELMLTAKSEMVRQKAAETLMRELKPEEDSNVNIKIGMDDEAKSQQAKLVDHIGKLAISQREMLAAGLKIEDIQKLNIVREEDIIDADLED